MATLDDFLEDERRRIVESPAPRAVAGPTIITAERPGQAASPAAEAPKAGAPAATAEQPSTAAASVSAPSPANVEKQENPYLAFKSALEESNEDLKKAGNEYLSGLSALTGMLEERLLEERIRNKEKAIDREKVQRINALGDGLSAIANLATTIGGGTPMQLPSATRQYDEGYERRQLERQERIDNLERLREAAEQGRLQTLYNLRLQDIQGKERLAEAGIAEAQAQANAEQQAFDNWVQTRKLDNADERNEVLRERNKQYAEERKRQGELKAFRTRTGKEIKIALPDGGYVTMGENDYMLNLPELKRLIEEDIKETYDPEIERRRGNYSFPRTWLTPDPDNAERSMSLDKGGVKDLVEERNAILSELENADLGIGDIESVVRKYLGMSPRAQQVLKDLGSGYEAMLGRIEGNGNPGYAGYSEGMDANIDGLFKSAGIENGEEELLD